MAEYKIFIFGGSNAKRMGKIHGPDVGLTRNQVATFNFSRPSEAILPYHFNIRYTDQDLHVYVKDILPKISKSDIIVLSLEPNYISGNRAAFHKFLDYYLYLLGNIEDSGFPADRIIIQGPFFRSSKRYSKHVKWASSKLDLLQHGYKYRYINVVNEFQSFSPSLFYDKANIHFSRPVKSRMKQMLIKALKEIIEKDKIKSLNHNLQNLQF